MITILLSLQGASVSQGFGFKIRCSHDKIPVMLISSDGISFGCPERNACDALRCFHKSSMSVGAFCGSHSTCFHTPGISTSVSLGKEARRGSY